MTGADRRAADRQLREVLFALSVIIRSLLSSIGPPAADFLSQRQRRRILQMGAANLDDVPRIPRSFAAAFRLAGQGRQHLSQHAVSAATCIAVGNVSLELCDMLTSSLGCTRRALPCCSSSWLAAVGNHLVDVHVGLRAAAGLPHHQGKMLVPSVPCEHLIGRPPVISSSHAAMSSTPSSRIDQRRAFLQARPTGADDRHRGIRLRADAEILIAALRLRPPQ
jgi:hypothetical protein